MILMQFKCVYNSFTRKKEMKALQLPIYAVSIGRPVEVVLPTYLRYCFFENLCTIDHRTGSSSFIQRNTIIDEK